MKISNKTAASLMQLLLDTVEMQQEDITTLMIEIEELKGGPKPAKKNGRVGAAYKSTDVEEA